MILGSGFPRPRHSTPSRTATKTAEMSVTCFSSFISLLFSDPLVCLEMCPAVAPPIKDLLSVFVLLLFSFVLALLLHAIRYNSSAPTPLASSTDYLRLSTPAKDETSRTPS